MIDCSEIIQTRDYLLQKFQACSALESDDMQLLVDLVYSINQCSAAISFEEIDLGTNTLNKTIAQLVNESATFTIQPNKLVIFTYLGSDGITYKYVSALPAGTYGQSNPIFTANDLILVMKDSYQVLNDKIDNLDTDDIAEGSTNLYFTNTRVANAPAVVANTAKVSATGSVTTHSDVTSAGSGAIITNAERAKLAGLESSKFLGTYVSLSALQAAHPSPTVGSYAYVDSGPLDPVSHYIWDSNDNQYVEQTGGTSTETPATIKTKYESNANTNVFTDAEKILLSNQIGVNTGDQDADEVPVSFTPTNYTPAVQNVEEHLISIDAKLNSILQGGITYVDSTGNGLTGTQDGSNTTFTVSEGEYLQDILVFVNGQLYWEDNGIELTDPMNGVFDFEVGDEPEAGDGIFVYYKTSASSGSSSLYGVQYDARYVEASIVDMSDLTSLGTSSTLTFLRNTSDSNDYLIFYDASGSLQYNINIEGLRIRAIGSTDISKTMDIKSVTSSTTAGDYSYAATTYFVKSAPVVSGDIFRAMITREEASSSGGGSNDRADHFGTQTASTISDFDTAVAAAPSVTANTAKVTNQTHTGEVTGSVALTIANDVVTNVKLANMAANTIKGRSSTTGDPQDLTATQVRAIINVEDGASNNRTNHTGTQLASTISDFDTAVAGTPAVTANTAKVGNATHTGDVTGATALTIANDVVTNAKLANMAANTIKGRQTSTGDPTDLTAAQVRAILNIEDGATATILDNTPTNGSTNGVESNGVFDALEQKADLTSSNTFTSGNTFQSSVIVAKSVNPFLQIRDTSNSGSSATPRIWLEDSNNSVVGVLGFNTGNVMYVRNSLTNNEMRLGGSGSVVITGLSGSGTQMLVANSSGAITRQDIPGATSDSYTGEPSVSGTASGTYSLNTTFSQMDIRREGQVAYFTCRIDSLSGSATGSIRVVFPGAMYPSASAGEKRYAVTISRYTDWGTGTYDSLHAELTISSSFGAILFYTKGSASNDANSSLTAFTASGSSDIVLSGHYFME